MGVEEYIEVAVGGVALVHAIMFSSYYWTEGRLGRAFEGTLLGGFGMVLIAEAIVQGCA